MGSKGGDGFVGGWQVGGRRRRICRGCKSGMEGGGSVGGGCGRTGGKYGSEGGEGGSYFEGGGDGG